VTGTAATGCYTNATGCKHSRNMDRHVVYWASEYKTAVHFRNLGFVRSSNTGHVVVMVISDCDVCVCQGYQYISLPSNL
jgi:hypothetical protein